MLLYISPIFGGILADKYLGYRYAIVIGAAIMTLGHLFMAFDTPLFLYLGLGALVVGTGFFKPNMTSILSRSEEHTSELQSRENLVCRLLLEKKNIMGMLNYF